MRIPQQHSQIHTVRGAYCYLHKAPLCGSSHQRARQRVGYRARDASRVFDIYSVRSREGHEGMASLYGVTRNRPNFSKIYFVSKAGLTMQDRNSARTLQMGHQTTSPILGITALVALAASSHKEAGTCSWPSIKKSCEWQAAHPNITSLGYIVAWVFVVSILFWPRRIGG